MKEETPRLSWSQPIKPTASSAVKSTSSNNSTATPMEKEESGAFSMYGMSAVLFVVSWNCVRHIAHYPSLMGGWWSIVAVVTLILALVLLINAVKTEFF